MASNVVLTGLARDLAHRSQEGNSVRVGLIGAGEMGTDIVTRTAMMEGVDVVAISDIEIPKAHDAVSLAYRDTEHSQEAKSTDALNAIIANGRTAITENVDHILESGLVDVIIDATGIPAVGADIGLRAMQKGKHLVMMNVEADVTIGAYLRNEAKRLGVIYSLGAGDEPSSCMELIEFVTAMGHKVVCAGKGKNNPLNIDATPDAYLAEAVERNMNARLLVEFVDGSKTAVEMAAIGNATGLVPDVDGMHGPAACPKDLAKVLIPMKDGGILSDIGKVDYSIGKGVSPGVFCIVEAEHPRIHERMKDLKMGDGPYYEFIRPYHLTSLEVPLTCARAVLYGKADMIPLERPVVEVCALAKKDLNPGDEFDQIGEYTYRAWAMEVSRAQAAVALPAGMLTGATVTAPIKKGELITAANAKLPDTKLVELRRRQDIMLYGKDLLNV
jgi:predicted homoserine dehydrogenase-like protein